MNSVKISVDACKKCGMCILECPMTVLQADPQKIPGMVPGGDEACNRCGHCEAICPHQAIRLEDAGLEKGASVMNEKITKEQMNHHIQTRRSIRKYRDRPVDKAVIEEIMDAVRYAPSAMNSQIVRWMIIHDAREVKKLTDELFIWMKSVSREKSHSTPFFSMLAEEKLDVSMLESAWKNGFNPIFYNAPHVAIAYTRRDMPTAMLDSAISLSYLDMTLPAYNLGACWAGFFQIIAMSYPELVLKLGLPGDHMITGALMFGYPGVKYPNIPKRNRASILWK